MKNRPTIYDEVVLNQLAELYVKPVSEWIDDDYSTNEDIKKDLIKAFDYSDFDSYKIVKKLDDMMWECDSSLVELFNSVYHKAYAICEKLVNNWVIEEKITAQFKINDEVSFKHYCETCEGIITKIDSNQAKYYVFCSKLGHVKEGIGRHAIILDFEKVNDKI